MTPARADLAAGAARIANIVGIIGIAVVLATSLYYQFGEGDHPCKLCQLQRVCLIGVALGAAMNLTLGMRVRHYAISILFAVSGALAAGRHILINACPVPGEPSGFGPALLGLHTYTWAFTVFGTAIFASAAMLMWPTGLRESDSGGHKRPDNALGLFAVGLMLAICLVMTASAVHIAATR